MRKSSFVVVAICAALVGCMQPTPSTTTAANEPVEFETTGDETAALDVSESMLVADEAIEAADASSLAALPAAPWAGDEIASADAPASLVSAWASAENSTYCAPLLPANFGVEGVTARSSELHGGWAVEFDGRGMPGIRENGNTCTRCGRGVFGVAGTGMSPDEMVDMDAEVAAPSFNDGSTADVLAEEGVASATITVQGQGCVYQVWSFLGEEHLQGLVNQLRFVTVEATGDSAVAAAH